MNAAHLPTPGSGPWTEVCPLDAIWPDTGVAARVGSQHVAVFRVGADRVYAIDNVDPRSGASVMARGLVGSLGERVVVAAPLYKQHVDLATGECLEDPALSVAVHPVRVEGGRVWVAAR